MSTKRLQARVPSARKVGTGVLHMHELRFHKLSHVDGTAKCDVSETGVPDHMVHGVLFDIDRSERLVLDRIEGIECGYEVKDVEIRIADGSIISAFTYYATHIDTGLLPYCWYLEHVITGAREHALPEGYIRVIEKVEYISDPDPERREKELSIYSQSHE
jgi:gamma-glutamylcyclotransferase (GGCT)/AIG2-like uncharacterized protein YtfP